MVKKTLLKTAPSVRGALPPSAVRGWAGVVSIGLGSFALVLSELLPIALLRPIAVDLHVSEGTAALMVAIPAIVAAIAALTLAGAAGRVDRRILLLGFGALLLASNLLAFWAGTFAVMIAARVLLGIAIGGFWAIAASLGPRLVHERFIGQATAIIFGGISIATVLAVPLGSFIGAIATWRTAFLIAAILSAAVVAAHLAFVPGLPSTNPSSLRTLPHLLRNSAYVVALLVVALVFMGQFSAYTFVTPLLASLGFSESGMSGVLLAFGVGGVLGNFLVGPLAAKRLRLLLLLSLGLLLASIAGSLLVSASPLATITSLLLWGIAFGSFPVIAQTWVFATAGDYAEAGSALLVATLQIGIAAGSTLGGAWFDAAGASAPLWFGGAVVALGMLIVIAPPGASTTAPPRPSER